MFSSSNEVTKLFTALFAAQDEFPDVKKDARNPHFSSRYATLDAAKETLEPILRKHGLSISQPAAGDGVGTGCTTILFHAESGQYLAETLLLPSNGPGKDTSANAQSATAAVTYARRTGFLSILGAIADNDDDGNTAVGRTFTKKPSTSQTNTKPAPTKTAQAPEKASIPNGLTGGATNPAAISRGESTSTTTVSDDNTKPTSKETEEFKKRFVSLTAALSKAGLETSKGWPQSKKVLAFLLSYAKAETADGVTKESWVKFFERADLKLATPEGTKQFIELVEKAVAQVKK